MGKIPITFDEFHKGIDSATSPRDTKKGYLPDVVNMMVDEVGIIRTMGGIENHTAQGTTNQATVTIEAGKGLYAFSHDRIGGENTVTTGTHDDSVESATVMTDTDVTFPVDSLIGATINNITDGSTGTITDNNATTVTVASLSGGTDDSWDDGDTYTITNFPETSDDYLAIMDSDATAAVRIWSKETAVWSSSAVIDIGSTAGVKATFHSFDGGLRVSDGNFGAANRTKWYGYIKREKFWTAANTPEYTDDKWYVKNNDLARPVSTGAFAEDAEGAAPFSNANAGSVQEVNVNIETTENSAKPESEWQKEWECGATFVYDGTQETLVQQLTGTVDKSSSTDLSTCRFELQIFSAGANTTPANVVDPRITHTKVYIREVGTKEWFVQGVWDLRDGGRLINGDVYDYWADYTGDGGDDNYAAYNNANPQPIPQILHTWESETGLFNDEKSIDIGQTGDGYLCSVVMGRTVYVGNVKRKNFEGETIIEADAIYKSIPDQPDTFPASWRIDAAINDGEGITALHKWGSDLLQFKHRTLYIIDTSGEIEVLKPNGTLKKAGARNSAIITETPHGLVWANEWGLWLWNGELQNLLSQDVLGNEFITIKQTTIEQSTWSTFINSNSYLGYYAYKQQIIIGDDSTASGAGNIYIYDFRTGSMVRGLAKFTASQLHTNFVTDSNDDLVIAHTTGSISKWGDTETATSNQEVIFPEVGTAGKLFRTKECSVTYKSSETQATPLYYRIIGSNGEPGSWIAFASENFLDTGDGTSELFHRLVFDASAFLETEFIQLKLDFASSGIIQIDDVTLSIRPLSFKRVS